MFNIFKRKKAKIESPKIGEEWAINTLDSDLADPWSKKTYPPVIILGVKEEWVRYFINNVFPDERMEINRFINIYHKVIKNESKLAEMKISNKLLEELLIRSFGSLSTSYENSNEKSRMDFFTSGLPKDFKIVKMEAEQDQLSIIFKSESNKDLNDNEKIPERYFTMSTKLMNCFTCRFFNQSDFWCSSIDDVLNEDPHSFFCANHKFKKGE